MKEAFELIKERLEEESKFAVLLLNGKTDRYVAGVCDTNKKAIQIVSEVEAEYENDVCEWERIAINTYSNRTHDEIYGSRVLDWCACPYCGKKVKVVE